MAPNYIMIVDDNPANLKLLEDTLLEQGHEVRAFPRGRLALAAAAANPPDLILLDINMPEMSGYEVCEAFKANSTLCEIPIIFLSALNDTEDKVSAFRSGGVDYVSKPFQFEEVHARVETHLKLHGLQRELRAHNQRLEDVIAARTLELAEAHKRLTILDHSKKEFLDLISHELRTPLHGILGVSEILFEDLPESQQNAEWQALYQHSRRRILSILDDSLLLTEIDVNGPKFRPAALRIDSILSQALERASGVARVRRATFDYSPSSALTMGVEDLFIRAFQALLETAVKFSKEAGIVAVSCHDSTGSPTVVIESQGHVIPEAVLGKFFDLFAMNEATQPPVI